MAASLLVSLGTTSASAGATWSEPRTAAAPFSWTPGKALASSTGFVLSAWASDCPPPKGACATNHGPRMGVFVQRARSDTVGLPWSSPRRLSPGNVQAERATIAARGTRVLAGWVTQTKVTGYRPGARRVFWVRRSRDQGKHWGAPIRLSAAKGRVDYPRVALAGGRAFAVWTDAKSGNIRLAASTDGGAHWSTKTIGSTNAHAGRPREGRSGLPDLGASGQNLVSVFNLVSNTISGPFFFTDADLNSANVILTAPLSALGLTPDTQFDFAVLALDNYFTGELTDAMEGMTYTPSAPRFVGVGVPAAGVPADGSSLLSIGLFAPGLSASPSQSGLLLLYRDGKPGREADAIRVLH